MVLPNDKYGPPRLENHRDTLNGLAARHDMHARHAPKIIRPESAAAVERRDDMNRPEPSTERGRGDGGIAKISSREDDPAP